MSTVIVKKTNYLDKRRAQVAEIIKKHSQKLFGYSHASIKEIRSEAIRNSLEAAFNA